MKRKSRIGILQVKAEEKVKKQEKPEVVYEDVIPQKEITIADGIKLVFSVSRTKDGRPHVDIRTHIETEKYTGPTKKGINFDVECLEDMRLILQEVDEELREKGI